MTRSLKATKSQAKPTLGEFTETEAGVYQSVFTTGTQSGEATITVSVDGMSKTVTAELRATMMDVANSTSVALTDALNNKPETINDNINAFIYSSCLSLRGIYSFYSA